MNNRSNILDRSHQQVRGVFILKSGKHPEDQIKPLMSSLKCTVISQNDKTVMVKSTRGNLQAVQDRLASSDVANALGTKLRKRIKRLVIGGSIN